LFQNEIKQLSEHCAANISFIARVYLPLSDLNMESSFE